MIHPFTPLHRGFFSTHAINYGQSCWAPHPTRLVQQIPYQECCLSSQGDDGISRVANEIDRRQWLQFQKFCRCTLPTSGSCERCPSNSSGGARERSLLRFPSRLPQSAVCGEINRLVSPSPLLIHPLPIPLADNFRVERTKRWTEEPFLLRVQDTLLELGEGVGARPRADHRSVIANGAARPDGDALPIGPSDEPGHSPGAHGRR